MSEAAVPAGFSWLLSDERLTRRAVGGDEWAFAAIFRRYHQSLYRFCLAIVGNPEDAQDALQNTMIKVLRALPGEEREIDLRPWLYRVAHNEAIDLLRRRRETRELDDEQLAPGYGLAEEVATRERLRRLLTDLQELPERQREVLVMRELSGLSFEEVAAALGTSGGVARQTLYEARQSLRQMEEGREMGCDAVTRALSDGDGRVARRRDLRAHLRSCASCRAFGAELKRRQHDLAALSPLPGAVAAGMLHGLLGGGPQAASGGGLTAALGGGAAKTIGASAAAKGAATVAVVAALGVTAADRAGVVHLRLSGESSAKLTPAAPGDPAAALHEQTAGPATRDGAGAGAGAQPDDELHPSRTNDSPAVSTVPSPQAEEKWSGPAGYQTHGAPAAAPQQAPVAEDPIGRDHEKELPEATTGGEEAAGDENSSPGTPVDTHGNGKAKGKAKNGAGSKANPPKSEAPGAKAKGPPVNPPEGAVPEAPPQAPAPKPPAGEPEAEAPGASDGPGKGAEKGKGAEMKAEPEKGKGHS